MRGTGIFAGMETAPPPPERIPRRLTPLSFDAGIHDSPQRSIICDDHGHPLVCGAPILCRAPFPAGLTPPHHGGAPLPAWAFRKAFHLPSAPTHTYRVSSLVWPGPRPPCTMGTPPGRGKLTAGRHSRVERPHAFLLLLPVPRIPLGGVGSVGPTGHVVPQAPPPPETKGPLRQ